MSFETISRPSPTFVGRAPERAFFNRIVEDVVAGRGAWVEVTGPAGIGKTRLLGEFSAAARDEGLRLLWSRRDGRHDGSPGGWSSIARDLGLRVDDASPTAFADAIEVLARDTPMAVFFDDLEHVDELNRQRFAAVAGRTVDCPLLLVSASTRPVDLLVDIRPHPVALRGLSAEECREFVSVLGATPPDDVLADLHDLTAGTPLFVEEICSLLRSSPSPVDLPRSASQEAAVLAQLTALAEEERLVLDAVATADAGLAVDALTDLLGLRRDTAWACVRSLSSAGLLEVEHVERGRAQFRHGHLRAMVAETIPRDRRARLLLEHGRRLERAGEHVAADRDFREAAVLARAARRWDLAGEAALAYAGEQTSVGQPDPHRLAFIEDFLESGEHLLARHRALLTSALAIQRYYHPDRRSSEAIAREAIALARESGDREALGWATSAACFVLAGPADHDERLRLGEESLRLGRELRNSRLHAQGELWGYQHRLEGGDGAASVRHLEVAERLVGLTEDPRQRQLVAAFRTQRALIESRLDDALSLADETLGLGEAAGLVNRLVIHFLHHYEVERERGNLAVAVPILEEFASTASGVAMTRPLLALALAETGDIDKARMEMAQCAMGGLANLDRDAMFLPVLAVLTQVASSLEDRSHTDTLETLLLPYEGLHSFIRAAGYQGAVVHHLGLLARLRGDDATAIQRFEAALDAHQDVGAVAMRVRSAIQLACSLRDAGGEDRRARADRLLLDAADLTESHGLIQLAEEVQELLSAQPRHGAPAEFLLTGESWAVTFRSTTVHIADSKGMRLLRELLRAPGAEVHVLDLVVATEGHDPDRAFPDGRARVGGSADSVLDSSARDAYRARISDLESELAEAKRNHDLGRVDALAEEQEWLVNELGRSLGLGGRDRATPNNIERARVNTTRNIRTAIGRIEDLHRELGRHLQAAIKTGTFCSYRPDPARMPDWRL